MTQCQWQGHRQPGGNSMSEISLAVGDGMRRMTYAELANARGISLPAARRLTLRHHWPKQMGNDGLVRVSVPLSALEKPRKPGPDNGSASDPTSDTREPSALLRARWPGYASS